jgi:basic membrane protein A
LAPGVADLIANARVAQNGKLAFPTGNYLGPVGFAPYHDMDGKISANVKNLMHALTTGLLDGTIKTSIPLTKP